MSYRALTSSEAFWFLFRHPFASLKIDAPGSFTYVWDDTLQGNVLMFRKTDGDLVFVLTDLPTATTDEFSQMGYWADETLKALAENAKKVLPKATNYFLLCAIFIGAFLAISLMLRAAGK